MNFASPVYRNFDHKLFFPLFFQSWYLFVLLKILFLKFNLLIKFL